MFNCERGGLSSHLTKLLFIKTVGQLSHLGLGFMQEVYSSFSIPTASLVNAQVRAQRVQYHQVPARVRENPEFVFESSNSNA
jgi:hypothetical protein